MRLTARIAPYLTAIGEARQRGLTWPDIAALLGVPPDPLRRAYLHGKRYLAEQQPLPEDRSKDKVQAQAPAAPAAPRPVSGKSVFDSLPKIGGK